MQVTINGKPENVRAELSITELLEQRHVKPVRVAVELNEDVVPRKDFSNTTLSDGDRIEIVTFVGGG
jgi:thiamine biosynthesis protein ThiS